MKKTKLIILIIAMALLALGVIFLTFGIINTKKSDTITNTYPIEDSFDNIEIDLETSKLSIEKSTDGKNKVVCVETEKQKHSVDVSDNTLKVKYGDERRWYEKIFDFSFTKKKVTIYLTSELYSTIVIETSTGDVTIPSGITFESLSLEGSTSNVSLGCNVNNLLSVELSTGDLLIEKGTAKKLQVSTSTGDVEIKNEVVLQDTEISVSTGRIKTDNFKGNNLNITTSNGNVTLSETIIEKNIKIRTSTGDVKLLSSDAQTLKIETSTGDVEGTLLTNKIIYAETSTGEKNVPHLQDGGLCEITTSTGDITITIKGE